MKIQQAPKNAWFEFECSVFEKMVAVVCILIAASHLQNSLR